MNRISTTRHGRPPRGFALPAAIFGLVIVGVLVTGGFYIARQETRIGIANRQATRAFYLAERGLSEVMENWDASQWSGVSAWTVRTMTDTLDEGVWTVQATKMSDFSYFLDGTGEITRGGELLSGATRRLGVAAKLFTAQIDPPAALTTRGNVGIRGGAEVNGYDGNPAGWDVCPAATEDKPGVLTDPDGTVTTDGGGSVAGDPPTDTDEAIADSTFTKFGDLDWDDLVELANIRLPGGTHNNMAPAFTADGSCNYADLHNWGDPLTPTSDCGGYFPIIHINGDMLLQSNAVGQGILLVEGDVDLRGTFIFHGIIIAQGSFQTQGSGHRIMGGVLASNAILDQERIVGSSIVQYSSCAVSRAILENAALTRVRPLTQRSWVDLSNLVGGG
jgi:hypothetical protein